MSDEKKNTKWLWPDVSTLEGARSAAMGGVAAAGIVAATLGPKNPIMVIFFTLALINAVRGTFSYHCLMKEQSVGGSETLL